MVGSRIQERAEQLAYSGAAGRPGTPLRDSSAASPANTAIKSVSIVVPIYNENGNVRRLHQEISDVLTEIRLPYEIIFVDDGSTDGSTELLRTIAARDRRSRLVVFRRNYGQTSAMQAGIDLAGMDCIVTIDGDLQNDPADIPAMLAKLDEGYDLVHGWRKDRKDALVNRKIPSRIANWLISNVTRFPIHDLGCTLKAMRREILQEVELYGEMHRFIPILMHQRGARCTEIVTRHRPRLEGKTKYGLGRTITVFLDLFTVKYMLDYSSHPMRIFGGLGLICFSVALLALGATVAMKAFGGVDMTGNPFLLMSVVSGLAALQLLSLGLIGEINARIYFAGRKKTPYAVRELVNFDEAPADTGETVQPQPRQASVALRARRVG